MADAPEILKDEKLRDSYPKLNAAIRNSNEALSAATTAETNSTNAVITANEANAKSDTTQQQLDTIILDSGTSDAETLQARGGFPLLYNRLDETDASVENLLSPINLLPPLKQWTRHANAVIVNDYKLQLNATAGYQFTYIDIKVKPSTNYVFSATHTGRLSVASRNVSGTQQILAETNGGTLNVTSLADTDVLRVFLTNTTAGTYIYENLMLTEGSRVISFKPQSKDHIKLKANKDDVNDRGVNLRTLGAVLDGVADDYQIVMDALTTYKNVVVPGDAIIGTSNTIVVGQGQSLIGLTDNVRGYGKTAQIKYIGALNRKRAVVRMGKNALDAEPSLDGTDIQFKNFIVDGNNLAGFGVYGTYLTNETAIDNVVASNTLEYAMYFARSWYAKYTKLVALNNTGQGLAFGMPLEYSDGTAITWATANPLEMNNCVIDDVRANNNGKAFSVDAPNTYNPTDPAKRRKGYGIGFGVGNSFNAKKFTTEKNGGTGLYVYTDSQPIKTIKEGYIENNCLNSGLDPATTMAGMIIENISPAGGNIYIRDVFMKYEHGGIYHTGVLGRKVWLENIQQPRFLKSLDGLTAFQLYAEVLKKGVYVDAGMHNTWENAANGIDVISTVDTRNSFTVSTKQTIGYKLIFVKGDGTTPWGSFVLNYDDGTTASRTFPTGLGTSYILATVANGNLTSITKGGGTGATASNVTFKVVNTPYTYI